MTEQSTNRKKERLRTVSNQDMTQESQTCDQKETLLLNNKMVGRKTNIAACLMSRDYKGYVKRQLGNGVIEVMADVNVIGSLEAKFESTNRIYDVGGCSPTLSTMQCGNQEPKILEAMQLGFMDNGTGKHQSNTVYDENALSPNITTVNGGGTQQIKVCESQIVAMRGRVQDGGKICPTIMAQNQELCKIETKYRIRKLTPRECGRLMGVSDEDIDKMATVNSNTQLYKQFGNSIVVDVMCAMFQNLNINKDIQEKK